jgi:uncharacterized protein (DUF433 family)
LVAPTHGWAFSFHDLVSLAVVAIMRQRGITPLGVRTTIGELQRRFICDRPLAHVDIVEGLATVGRSVISPEDSTDLTAAGQGILVDTIRQYVRPIEYGSGQLARLWRPSPRILVDPHVQVGHPCVEFTRITTDTLAGRAAQGEPLELIADDLGIEFADAEAAVAFEARLDAGQGLALVA